MRDADLIRDEKGLGAGTVRDARRKFDAVGRDEMQMRDEKGLDAGGAGCEMQI